MNAPSLSGFLEMTEANYRLFDLGTVLRKLPSNTLKSLDEGEPYPFPYLGYGWLVIFLWNNDLSDQNSLWFMKMPLDEQGIVSAAAHSDLVNRFYKSLQTSDAKERQRLLTDHPYQFSPAPEKMAALHATATQVLGLPPSDYYAFAQDALTGKTHNPDWATLGLQGVADVVQRSDDAQIIALSERVSGLESMAQLALLQQFEHRALPTKTLENLVRWAEQNKTQEAIVVSVLRACSQSAAYRLLEPLVESMVESHDTTLEALLTILTRYPAFLDNDVLAIKLLDQLGQRTDADGFARIMTNLTMQTGMRDIVMRTLGSPHLTETLANALSRLIQQSRAPRNDH